MHVSLDLLLSVARGELPPGLLADLEADHVRERCPECRREWAEVGPDPGATKPLLGAPHAPLPRLPDLPAEDRFISLADYAEVKRRQSAIRRELRRARRTFEALLEVPREEWRERVATSRGAWHTRAFAELLLREAEARSTTDPELAYALADLVPEVLKWIPPAEEGWSDTLRSRAETYRAGAAAQ